MLKALRRELRMQAGFVLLLAAIGGGMLLLDVAATWRLKPANPGAAAATSRPGR